MRMRAPLAPGAPLGDVYFPTSLRPMRADLLSRASWQLRTRGGADVYLRLPLHAAVAAVGEANLPALFADMNRYTVSEGMAIDGDATGQRIVADLPGDIRARRASLDLATLDPSSRLALLAFRGVTSIDARQRLMLVSSVPGGPPDWADRALLPPVPDAAAMAALTRRLRGEGWLRPDVAGRVAFGLPADPAQQVDAIRQASAPRRHGFRALPQAARPAAVGRACRGVLGRHLSLPAVSDDARLEFILLAIPQFCFGYPFVMAWYWMAGGLIFYFVHERHLPPRTSPPPIDHWPPISILVPCYNESDNAEETLRAAAGVDYPDFEVIAINDGSRDNTAEVLDRLVGQIPRLRVVHLAKNRARRRR